MYNSLTDYGDSKVAYRPFAEMVAAEASEDPPVRSPR
jgi:hypothetical protein